MSKIEREDRHSVYHDAYFASGTASPFGACTFCRRGSTGLRAYEIGTMLSDGERRPTIGFVVCATCRLLLGEHLKVEPHCGFAEPWGGPCPNRTPCNRHAHLKCFHCNAPAVRGCEYAGSMLVCGVPECDKHRHHR